MATKRFNGMCNRLAVSISSDIKAIKRVKKVLLNKRNTLAAYALSSLVLDDELRRLERIDSYLNERYHRELTGGVI